MASGPQCGEVYRIERQVKYSSPNYLKQQSLTSKRCQDYFFMKVSPADTRDWKGYVDYVAEQRLSGEQLTLFADTERERLPTTLRLGDIRNLEQRGILNGLFGRGPLMVVA